MLPQHRTEAGLVVGVWLFSLVFALAAMPLLGSVWQSLFALIVLLILVVSEVALLALTITLTTHPLARAATMLGPSLILLLTQRFALYAIIGSALLLVTILLSQWQFRDGTENRIRYRVRDVFWAGSKLVMLGWLLALISLSFPTISQRVESGRLLVTSNRLERTISPSSSLLSQVFPGLSLDKTLNEMIQQQISKEIGAVPPNDSIVKAQQEVVLRQLSEQFALPLIGQETILDIAAGVVNKQIQRVSAFNPGLTAIILLVLLFLLLRVFIGVLLWPVMLVLTAFVWIGKRLGLIMLVEQPVLAQRLSLTN